MADLGQDPFEEFEFRPINEGLGFHKKNKTSNAGIGAMSTGSLVSPTLNPTSRSTPASNSFAPPLPRAEFNMPPVRPSINIPTIEDDSIAKAQTAVNEILKNLNQKRQMDFAGETEKIGADYRKSRPLMSAAALDAMLIVAAFLLSMIAMLSITKVDLFLNLSHPETSALIYVATGMLFAGVAFIYMIVNRAFLGYTPGEWAYDQRCGSEQEMQTMMYIPRVVLRFILVMGTGFILMPILSYLFNKDIAGRMTGAYLYRKANV